MGTEFDSCVLTRSCALPRGLSAEAGVVAPNGSEIAPASKPQPDGTLVKALARAWRWQRMLDDGTYATVSEIGAAENISKSYVSRILRLARLAPDIVEAILAGRTDQGMMLEQLEGPLPTSWEEQRLLVMLQAGKRRPVIPPAIERSSVLADPLDSSAS